MRNHEYAKVKRFAGSVSQDIARRTVAVTGVLISVLFFTFVFFVYFVVNNPG